MFIFHLDTGHSGLRYTVLSSLCLKFFKIIKVGERLSLAAVAKTDLLGLAVGRGRGVPWLLL